MYEAVFHKDPNEVKHAETMSLMAMRSAYTARRVTPEMRARLVEEMSYLSCKIRIMQIVNTQKTDNLQILRSRMTGNQDDILYRPN
jgi:hypothetical protein